MAGAAAGEGAGAGERVKFGTSGDGGGFIVSAGAFVDAISGRANPSVGVGLRRPADPRQRRERADAAEGKLDIGLVFGRILLFTGNP